MEITKENILKAIRIIDNNPNLLTGRASSTYDLVYNDKKYPPILVLSEANKINGGKELFLEDFENKIDIPFKIIRDNGFEIVKKDWINDELFHKKTNYKEAYTKWLITGVDIQESTKKQYSNVIEKLSEKVGYNIFEVANIEKIDLLYNDLIKTQKEENNKYYNINVPSLGKKGWYSASIKTYSDFLKSINSKVETVQINDTFDFTFFSDKINQSGLIFSQQLIQRFIASLCTKPFVICSGLSGSGKTKLAQAFVQWISETNSQYKIIPIGADWTNREPLLGYPNAIEKDNYVVPENGALELIVKAIKDKKRPYFLILDEMNLSHVERYFADFLSAMESGEAISLHTIEYIEKVIPKAIKLPKNLFIIGTVNIDETTYMFSPKVLDRANTIEFRLTDNDLKAFIDSSTPLNMDLIKGEGASMGESFVEMATNDNKTNKNLKDVEEDLIKFFKELKKSGAEFGYRTANEIGRLMLMLEQLGEKDDNLLDIAIMQKLLPKLHGSRNKLTKVLPVLGGFCLIKDTGKIKEDYLDKFVINSITEEELRVHPNIKYPISFEKICRMYKNSVENGFASYAEA